MEDILSDTPHDFTNSVDYRACSDIHIHTPDIHAHIYAYTSAYSLLETVVLQFFVGVL